MPSYAGDPLGPGQSSDNSTLQAAEVHVTKTKDYVEGKQDSGQPPTPTSGDPPGEKGGRTRKTSRSGEPFDQAEREEMEHLLEELQGHLGKCYLYLYPGSLTLSDDLSLISDAFP